MPVTGGFGKDKHFGFSGTGVFTANERTCQDGKANQAGNASHDTKSGFIWLDANRYPGAAKIAGSPAGKQLAVKALKIIGKSGMPT